MNNVKKIMRDVFIEQIYRRMHDDKTLFFMAADFGSPKLDKLRADFSDRFINVGIAEQNLVNVAAGLALEGFTVYAYAIAPFLTMRAYEQIRNNLALLSHRYDVNVNLVGVGAGLSYDVSGPTHHSIEDISIIRTLPNMTLFSPSDWILAEKFVDYSIKNKQPKYIRFDGKPLNAIYENIEVDLETGFHQLKTGDNICLVSTGYMTQTSLAVVNKLAEENIAAGLIDVFMLNPIKDDMIFEILRKYKIVISLEEAFTGRGGLDSLISGILNDRASHIRFRALGFKNSYSFEIGNREYLHKINRLDSDNIVSIVKDYMRQIA